MSFGGSSSRGKLSEAEEGLGNNVKKALTPDEVAPKQKHVRACILFTWDYKRSEPFWAFLRASPVLGDEIQTWKSLVLVHKVLRGGHPVTLKDGINQMSWLENLGRSVGSLNMSANGPQKGYGSVIKSYTMFLLAKLDYHRLHPDFNANFDYHEYTSLRRVEDPNEGYETIDDLLKLLDKCDQLQRQIFQSFRPGVNNECRISALVPLVEESFGIYTFCKSMLTAIHQHVGSTDVLAPLRDKFELAHKRLHMFYNEATNLRYLTSLITVPKLSSAPPKFYDERAPSHARSMPVPEPEPEPPQQREEAFVDMYEDSQRPEDPWISRAQSMEEMHRQQMEQQQQMMQQQLWQERQAREMSEQEKWAQVGSLQAEMERWRGQAMQYQELIGNYDQRAKMLEAQMGQMSLQKTESESRDSYIRSLEEQLNQLKTKYEALAKLYAQLRREHLELLQKIKDQREADRKVGEESKREADAARTEARAKAAEAEEAKRKEALARSEVDRLKTSQTEEVQQLRRDLDNTHAQLTELGRSKGDEIGLVMEKYEKERAELEELSRSKQRQLDDYRRQLDQLESELTRSRRGKDEEVAVLQTGMDQTLIALAQLQKTSRDTESNLVKELEKLQAEHGSQINRIVDAVLDTCIRKVDDSVYELESPNHQGNQTATPEYVLSVVEKAGQASNDLVSAFSKLVQGTGEQTDAINAANEFAQEVSQLIHNANGITRLADTDVVDRITGSAKAAALASKDFFSKVKSATLEATPADRRTPAIEEQAAKFGNQLSSFTKIVESLVPKDVSKITSNADDIADAVEREMMAAAKAIEDAANRIASLLQAPAAPGLSVTDMQVNSAVLESAMAITNAAANLIRCATVAQQEIVAHGRGSSTRQAFYLKNNRWTEGLISAAKAVAQAVSILVESADGVVKGTRKMEELVVAATEVSAATTQLVAASRVKSMPMSKTQDRLESAAVAVRDATKLLVKAAKDAAMRSSEARAMAEVRDLSAYEVKKAEMEQQVRILELEKDLTTARQKLASMRKKQYQAAVAAGAVPEGENGF